MQQTASWLVMGIIGVLFIIVGVEGSLGKVLACILTPSAIKLNE